MAVAPRHFSEQEINLANSMHDTMIRSLNCTVGDLYLNFLKYKHDATAFRQLYESSENAKRRVMKERDILCTEKDKLEDRAESQILQAQKAAFEMTASSTVVAEDDGIIRQKLSAVTSQWKTFAKKWALKGPGPFKSLNEGQDFVEILQRPYISDTEIESVDDGITSVNYQSMLPRMLLHAELAHFICWNIAQSPFLSVAKIEKDYREDPEDKNSPSISILQCMTQEIARESAETAASWRAQTVGLFGKPFGDRKMTVTQKLAERRRMERYIELADEFERGISKCLFRPCSQSESSERTKSLTDLITDSGELFTSLWMQKLGVQALQLEDLRQQGPFRIGAPEYEPHNLLRLETDDNMLDTRMDGKPIQFVIQPALVSSVTQSQDRHKIWSKAIVWVSSGSERKAEKRAGCATESGQTADPPEKLPQWPVNSVTIKAPAVVATVEPQTISDSDQTMEPASSAATQNATLPAATTNSPSSFPTTLRRQASTKKPSKKMFGFF